MAEHLSTPTGQAAGQTCSPPTGIQHRSSREKLHKAVLPTLSMGLISETWSYDSATWVAKNAYSCSKAPSDMPTSVPSQAAVRVREGHGRQTGVGTPQGAAQRAARQPGTSAVHAALQQARHRCCCMRPQALSWPAGRPRGNQRCHSRSLPSSAQWLDELRSSEPSLLLLRHSHQVEADLAALRRRSASLWYAVASRQALPSSVSGGCVGNTGSKWLAAALTAVVTAMG